MTTGEKIRKQRKKLGYSQENIADATGICQSKISLAETTKDKEILDDKEINLIAKFLKTSFNNIKGTPEKSKEIEYNIFNDKNGNSQNKNQNILHVNNKYIMKIIELEDGRVADAKRISVLEKENIMCKNKIKELKKELVELKQTYNIT